MLLKSKKYILTHLSVALDFFDVLLYMVFSLNVSFSQYDLKWIFRNEYILIKNIFNKE